MREDKYDKLLVVSIILIILSSVLLAIASYNVYFKDYSVKTVKQNKTNTQPTSTLRDSLQKVYNNTINDLKAHINIPTSTENTEEVKIKMNELDTLRKQITVLLADKNNKVDLFLAQVKIEELQQKVYFLQNKFSNAEAENKRLQKLISQLLNAKQTPSVASSTALNEKLKIKLEKNTPSNTPIAGALHLFAVVNNNTKEQETTDADNAEKMVGTFVVKNLPAKGNGELLIVVLQPDGKVVKNSVWESGTFETTEGKKIYSRKIYAEPATEEKQLNFSLTPDKFLKGDYTMQIWYNGSMIAKMIKTLS